MKILWLVNIIMPELAVKLGQNVPVFGGWLSGALNAVKASGHELIICTTDAETASTKRYEVNNVVYYLSRRGSFQAMQEDFKSILQQERPDVIHIYGTEYEHAWAMASITDPNRTVVTIQGPLCYYKDNVYAGIPEKVCRDTILHKVLRKAHKGGESIERKRIDFERRSEFEINTLKKVKYIHGGSVWGCAVAKSINPDCEAFDFGLILRDSFYCDDRWSYENCDKHSIYVLFSYSIKGFHKFLEALRIVVRKYPDTHVKVVASKLQYRSYGRLKKAIMDAAPDYNWYVQGLIDKYGLKDHLQFLGYLSEQEVKKQMLSSNVFVSASSIENQSTTLGEAMILGVPSVASCVGAIQEMIDDGEDGFLYPFHEPYVLADRIMKVFEDADLARKFSLKGHEHAAKTYDCTKNSNDLLKMYETIVNG